jgi:hypothetical protein
VSLMHVVCGDHLFYVFSASCTLCFALCFSTIINSPCPIVVHFMQWPNLSLGAAHFVVAYVTLVDFSHCANGFGGVCNWLNDHFVWCDLQALCLKLILFSLFTSLSLINKFYSQCWYHSASAAPPPLLLANYNPAKC